MAKSYKIGLIIDGDAKGSVKALQLTQNQLEGLNKKQKKATQYSKKYASQVSDTRKQLSTYAAVAAGVAAAAFTAMVKTQLESIDLLAKTADKLDLATESLQTYRHWAELSGVSQQKLDSSLERMVKRMGEAEKGIGAAKTTLEGMGLANQEFFKLKPDEQFKVLADKIGDMESAQEKAAATAALFGREGVSLVNMFKNGSEGADELSRKLDIAGVSLSRLDASKIEQANDAVTDAKLLYEGFANQITVKVAPIVKDLAEQMFGVTEETGGMGEVANKVFDYATKAAGVFANSVRGIQVVYKALQVIAAKVMEGIVFNLTYVDSGITKLLNKLPEWAGGGGFKDNEFLSGLKASLSSTAKDLQKELDDLLSKPLPSDAIEKYINDVTSKSTAAAKKLTASNKDIADSTGDIKEETEDLVDKLREELRLMELSVKDRKVQLALKKLDKDATDEQRAAVEELVLKIHEASQTKPDANTDDYIKSWQNAGERVASTLQDSIASGDWENLGQTVGGVFAGSISGLVTDSLMEALGDTEFGAVLGPVAGGLVGGLIGSVLNGISVDDYVPSSIERQATQGTGTVFGDINAKTKSIANSSELIASTNSELVSINRDMLNALQGTQNAVAGLSVSIFDSSFSDLSSLDTSTLRGRADQLYNPLIGGQSGAAFDPNSVLDNLVQDVVSAMGTGRLRVSDVGIKLMGGTLAELLSGTIDDSIVAFVDVFKRRSNPFGSDSSGLFTVSLGEAVNESFINVLQGVVDTVGEGLDVVGVDASVLTNALSEIDISETLFSLQNMNIDEVNAELVTMASEMLDTLAEETAPWVRDFADGLEGPGETLARLGTQFELVSEAADVLGFQMGETFGDIFGDAVTSMMPLAGVMADVALPTELMVGLADDLIERAGGIQKFSADMAGFEKAFLSQGEQAANMAQRLGERLGDLPFPETEEGFVQLMKSQNTFTEAGRDGLATILDVYDVAKQFYSLDAARVDFEKSISDQLATFDLSGEALETYNVERWYEAQLELANEHGADITQLDQLYFKKLAAIREQYQEEDIAARQGFEQSISEQLNSFGLSGLELDNYNLGKWYSEQLELAEEYGADTAQLNELYYKKQGAIRDQYNEEQLGKLSDDIEEWKSQLNELSSAFDSFFSSIDSSSLSIQRQTAGWNELGYQNSLINGFQTQLAGGGLSVTDSLGIYDQWQQAVTARYEFEASELEKQASLDQKHFDDKYNREMEAYRNQISALESLKSHAKSLKDFSQSLLTGDLSTLTTGQKLAQARTEFSSLQTRIADGDFSAAPDLQNAASNYLNIAREYFASGAQYSAIFNQVRAGLAESSDLIGDAAGGSPVEPARQMVDISKQLAELQRSALDELKLIKTQAEDLRIDEETQIQTEIGLLNDQVAAIKQLSADTSEPIVAAVQTEVSQLREQFVVLSGELERQQQSNNAVNQQALNSFTEMQRILSSIMRTLRSNNNSTTAV